MESLFFGGAAPPKTGPDEGRGFGLVLEVVASRAAFAADPAERDPGIPAPKEIPIRLDPPRSVAVPPAVAGLHLDARAGQRRLSAEKAHPIRVALTDTRGVGSGRKELRTKEDHGMTCTACDGRATRVRRASAPARRSAPARPCPAPALRSPEGTRERRSAIRGSRDRARLRGPRPQTGAICHERA